MWRDRFSGTGSSDDGETTERTGLVRHSSSLGQYLYFGSSSDRFDGQAGGGSTAGALMREENMTEYYRQTFTTRGISIGVREVTQVRRHRLQRCFPRTLKAKVACESVTAFWAAGQLHAIVDADGEAARAVVKAVGGETPCHAGEIVVGGGLANGKAFRTIVGVVSRSSAAAVPNLTVSRNLRFVLDMRTRGNREWKRLLIQSTTAFVGVGAHLKAGDLDPVAQFALRLAMELVLDPPVVIALRPFEGFDITSRASVAGLLKRVSTVLQKTVLVTSGSLGPHLFDVADTTLLFGGAGRVLYSGPTRELVPYFNDLRIPRHRQHDAGDAVDAGVGNELDGQTTTASSEGTSALSLHHHHQLFSETGTRTPSRAAMKANAGDVDGDDEGEEEERLLRRGYRDAIGGRGAAGIDDGDPSRLFQTPPRISSRLFSDGGGTLAGNVVAQAKRMGVKGYRTVRVCSGEDAVDLAVEWAESEAQTMYYTAKFYDSAAHQRLVEAVDTLANGADDAGYRFGAAPHVAEPQRAWRKPVVLLSYFTHQAFAEMELVLGTVSLLVALLIVSLLMHFQPKDQGGMYNIRGILFLLFSLVLITNEATMGGISGQLRLFFHQRNSGLYGTVCFVTCLTAQVVVVRALYLLILVPFVLTVVQASKGVVALVGVASVTHALLLNALSAVVPSRRFAAWASHAYFGFSLICSGFLLNLQTMPAFCGGGSIVRWGYGPALKERLQGQEFSCDGADNTSYCYTGEEYLAIEGFSHDSLGLSIFAMCAIGGASLVVLTVTLFFR